MTEWRFYLFGAIFLGLIYWGCASGAIRQGSALDGVPDADISNLEPKP